jgi:hypothetical protein
MTIEYAIDLAKKANGLLSLVAGTDDTLYRAWQYHVICTPDEKLSFIQGIEIDVDTRGKFLLPDEEGG